MRRLTNDEYYKVGTGYICKGYSCIYFKLDPFVAKYCGLETCNFKRAEPESEGSARECRGLGTRQGYRSNWSSGYGINT